MNLSSLMEGVVVDADDIQQMGRVKIWVPAVDGDMYNIADLPWATYTSPMAGQTRDYQAGPASTETHGLMSYGFWAVPKVGTQVVVGFLYNDPNKRVYISSYFRDHGNRSLPQGRNRPDIGNLPLSDTFDSVEPQNTNLSAQFQGNLTASEARTRGVYERQVAQDKTIKDGTEGYQRDLKDDKKYDSQTYVLATPGRHCLIFQDAPENGRVRLKSAAGHQIILDDANERIYVSTAKGNAYFEMDQDGRVHIYSAESMSFSSGGDVNISANGSFNVKAGGAVNIQAGAGMQLAACATMNMSGAGVNIDSSAVINILASGNIIQTGSNIHFNGPTAGSAACPTAPSVTPNHEPWVRAPSKGSRNRHWKP